MWPELSALLALFAISAFFSGSEAAYLSLSKLQVKEQEEDGSSAGSRVARLLADPQRLLLTVRVGNTLANVAVAVLAVGRAGDLASGLGLDPRPSALIGVLLVTAALVVFAEVAPKVAAVRNDEAWARLAGLPLQLAGILLWPLVEPVLALTRAIRRRMRGQERQRLSSEELRTLIEVGEEPDSLEDDEKKMIHSIVEFGETTVREVMVPRIDMVCLRSDTGLDEAIEVIQREGHSRVPIYRERVDNVIGVLYAKDLIPHLQRGESLDSLDQLARLPYFVPEGKKIDELLREFQTGRIHMAIVVDEYGGTAGLVTLEDILEEIVGEIQDEFDSEAPLHRRTDDGGWVIDSQVLLEDANALLGEEILPTEEDYETLGGFIYELAGEVPRASASFDHLGWRFTVMTMKRHRIGLVKVDRLEAASDDERAGTAG
jgi:putative hemolysin